MGNEESFRPQKSKFLLILKTIIPGLLLLGGIALLALRISGWSLIFGLPMVVFGTVFLIYTYDEVVSQRIPLDNNEIVACSICKQPTPLFPGVKKEDVMCFDCQEKIVHGIKKEEKS